MQWHISAGSFGKRSTFGSSVTGKRFLGGGSTFGSVMLLVGLWASNLLLFLENNRILLFISKKEK
jgi:hypothetical protein